MIVRTRKKWSEPPAVVSDSAHRNAGKARAVIAAVAADQPKSLSLPDLVEIAAGDFQRGIDRFRSRIDEEDVLKSARRQVGQSRCDFERGRMGKLERRRVIERAGGLPDRLRNLIAPMPGI